MDSPVEFTSQEIMEMAIALKVYAVQDGEDVIGVLMKQGAFRRLGDDGIVNLSRKVNQLVPDLKAATN